MGRVVTYYCDRCGLTIPKDKGASLFNLVVEAYSGDYSLIDKLICESCLNDLRNNWLVKGGKDNED